MSGAYVCKIDSDGDMQDITWKGEIDHAVGKAVNEDVNSILNDIEIDAINISNLTQDDMSETVLWMLDNIKTNIQLVKLILEEQNAIKTEN